jgi:hypothetical protein
VDLRRVQATAVDLPQIRPPPSGSPSCWSDFRHRTQSPLLDSTGGRMSTVEVLPPCRSGAAPRAPKLRRNRAGAGGAGGGGGGVREGAGRKGREPDRAPMAEAKCARWGERERALQPRGEGEGGGCFAAPPGMREVGGRLHFAAHDTAIAGASIVGFRSAFCKCRSC